MSIDSVGTAPVSPFATSLISKLDTGQKGYVDQSDLESAFSSIAGSDPSASASSADQLFAKLDTNGDGKVTASELSTSLKSFADALMQQLHQAGGGGHRPRMNPQQTSDPSSDPGMTQAELAAVAADPETGSKGASALNTLASNFTAADANGDGRVTRAEARSFLHSSRGATAQDVTAQDSTTAAATVQAAGTATVATSPDAGSSAGNSSTDNLMVMLRIMQLAQAYGVPGISGTNPASADPSGTASAAAAGSGAASTLSLAV